MTLYLDTSGLVKGYLQERGSAEVTDAMSQTAVVATSIVAYVEARAAFARARRENRIGASNHASLVQLLEEDWTHFATVAVQPRLVHDAARLIDRHSGHALRAFDAIHLASALVIAGGQPAQHTFACWDQRLWRAAREEGFRLLPPSEPA